MALPPDASQDPAHNVGNNVPRIADRASHKMGPHHFEQHGPDHEIQGNFAGRRRVIVAAQTQAALNQQQHGQRAGDEKQIVEMIVEKWAMNARFQRPAIYCI